MKGIDPTENRQENERHINDIISLIFNRKLIKNRSDVDLNGFNFDRLRRSDRPKIFALKWRLSDRSMLGDHIKFWFTAGFLRREIRVIRIYLSL